MDDCRFMLTMNGLANYFKNSAWLSRQWERRVACGSGLNARNVLMSAPAAILLLSSFAESAELKGTYPRIGAYEIGGSKMTADPDYRQALSKHDIVILGMWRNWRGTDAVTGEVLTIRDVVVDIKRRAAADNNRKMLIGKYTILMESSSDPGNSASTDKWNKLSSEVGPGLSINNDWWARNKNGENTSSFRNNWNTNVTEHVQRDANGDTWPEWAARRDYEVFFRDIPELDVWYIDNWFYKPRVRADWDGDGDDDDADSETVRRDYRKGLLNGLKRARQLAPDRIFIGNVDGSPQSGNGMLTEPEYKSQISGLYEGAMGLSWSQETWGSWESMMQQYQSTLANSRDRLLIMTVHGDANDYALMRYGLTSCLMDDGYYYYTAENIRYRSALWFDEYDADLGRAIDPPQFKAWQNGVYRRRFENGVVLVNPKGNGTRTVKPGPGYNRIDGTQDRTVNNGQAADSVTLAERDGIVLISDQSIRAPRPKPPQMMQ
jgi:hypothetical protein